MKIMRNSKWITEFWRLKECYFKFPFILLMTWNIQNKLHSTQRYKLGTVQLYQACPFFSTRDDNVFHWTLCESSDDTVGLIFLYWRTDGYVGQIFFNPAYLSCRPALQMVSPLHPLQQHVKGTLFVPFYLSNTCRHLCDKTRIVVGYLVLAVNLIKWNSCKKHNYVINLMK